MLAKNNQTKNDNLVFVDQFNFGSETTKVFDNMISRSIPGYNNLRLLIEQFILQNIENKNDFNILDIGCSTGIQLSNIIKEYNKCKYFLVDNSQSMIDTCIEKFNNNKNINCICKDICNFFDKSYRFNIILSILTIQFVPIENRKNLLKNIYNSLEDNGIFVFVEKTKPIETNERIFEDIYYDIKRSNGYTNNQIYSKKRALENYLRPLSFLENENLLKETNFKYECFWKFLNFTGWICYK